MEAQINLELKVKEASAGSKEALDVVLHEIKDMVYNLSLKMLLFPEDAKDATQEILIKVVTHLSAFKGDSKFTTWVYRVATNYLLAIKKGMSNQFAMPFDEYEQLIDAGQSDLITATQNEGLLSLLEEEVKVSCTHGLLLCLNASSRIVYILGELLDFNSLEGAEILEITPENFRKKLSRSRTKIRSFLEKKCGLADANNPCRCNKKIDYLVNEGIINPDQLRYAKHSKRSIDLISKIDTLDRESAIYRSVPDFLTPKPVIQEIRKTIYSIK